MDCDFSAIGLDVRLEGTRRFHRLYCRIHDRPMGPCRITPPDGDATDSDATEDDDDAEDGDAAEDGDDAEDGDAAEDDDDAEDGDAAEDGDEAAAFGSSSLPPPPPPSQPPSIPAPASSESDSMEEAAVDCAAQPVSFPLHKWGGTTLQSHRACSLMRASVTLCSLLCAV